MLVSSSVSRAAAWATDSEVYRAAGERPVAVVRPPDQQDVAGAIGHDDVDGRDEGAGLRGVRVVVVVDPAEGGQRVHPQAS
jgi:hypothetical protein